MNTHPRRLPTDASSSARRQAIAELIGAESIGSQSELARGLRRRGFRVTQATLSRDLKSLGIGKVPAEGAGYVYVLPGPARDTLDARRVRLELEAFVQEVKVVGNLALVRTPPGNAHGVGRALDLLGWPEVEGTLAGDDTVLIVTRSAQRAEKFRRHLAELSGRRLS
jgi:transcriptional regulator of arginine metabolism